MDINDGNGIRSRQLTNNKGKYRLEQQRSLCFEVLRCIGVIFRRHYA